jgi:DNA-binding transcriptional LysR family regulator
VARPLSFRHIEAVHAVVLTGSVTAAAARLHVSQPAISNLLREAEERLAFKLFDRHAGHLVPTSNAELLFEEIERSFVGMADINALCERLQRQQRQSLTIACSPAFGATVLPDALRNYRAQVADVYVTVHSRSAEHVAALVSSRKADIGFGLEVAAIPGVHSALLAELPMVCYLPPGHALGKSRRVLTAQQLKREPMITLSRHEGVEDIVAKAFRGEGGLPDIVATCPAAIAACAMVAAGLGFTIFDPLPASLLRKGALQVRAFEPALGLNYRVYWCPDHCQHFERERLLDFVRQALHDRLGPWKRASASMAVAAP